MRLRELFTGTFGVNDWNKIGIVRMMTRMNKLCWLVALFALSTATALFFRRGNSIVEKVITIRYTHYAQGCNVYQATYVPRKVSTVAEERRYGDSRRFLSEFLREWQGAEFSKAIKTNVEKLGAQNDWSVEDLNAALQGLLFELVEGDLVSGSAKGRVVISARGGGLANCLVVSCIEEMRRSVDDFNRMQFMRQASCEQCRLQRVGRELQALREQAASRGGPHDHGVSGLEESIKDKAAEYASIALEIEKMREKCTKDGAVIEFEIMQGRNGSVRNK